MAKKYGFWYVTKQVLKGLTTFGVAEVCGYLAESVCLEAGYGKTATAAAKVAGWAVGGMIADKTCTYIDQTAAKVEKAILAQAKSMEDQT